MNETEHAATCESPWLLHMRRGEFEAAWRVSDRALAERQGQPCWHWPRHLQYVWDGSSLEGRRVLIRCYHGLGDTIQFIRFAPLVKQIAKKVIVWTQPVLIPLLKRVDGIDRLMPLHDGVPDVSYDVDVEIMELAHVLRTTLPTLPVAPYLGVGGAEKLSADPNRKLAVGLVWAAGDWDDRRTLSARLLEPLTAIPGVEIHVLQDRRRAAEWKARRGVMLCPEPVDALARAIAGMDLVITIDSLAAHLAGAIGVKTWTLLHADPDWRWMEHRDDSPWYPTMRLFRQRTAGDWPPVVAEVASALRELSANAQKRAGQTPALH